MLAFKVFGALIAVFTAGFLYTSYTEVRLAKKYPVIGEITEIAGNTVHYLDKGAGQPLIFLHGASSSLRDFTSSILPSLSETYRVIAIDRPGYGNSTRIQGDWLDPKQQAIIVHSLLEKLHITQPVLLGHSWSGAIVLAYLLEYPDEAKGAILISPATYPWYSPAAIYNRIAGVPYLGRFFANTIVLPLGQLFIGAGIKNVLSPGEIPLNYRQEAAIDTILTPKTFLSNAEDLRNLSEYLEEQSANYPEISTPLLSIVGENDTVVSNAHHSEQLKQIIAGMEIDIVEKAGHAPHQTNTQQVIDLILKFVKKLDQDGQ